MSAYFNRCRIPRSFALAAALIITAHRLPAPVQELPDTTPASPSYSQTPKPNERRPSSTRSGSSTAKKSRASASATPSRSASTNNQRPTARFAGKWFGTIQTVPWGPWSVVLAVDPDETTLTQRINAEQPLTALAHRSGEMLQARFPAGLTTITWSLMPQPDGTTARVRFQAFMNDFTATFRRSGSESAGPKK